MGTTPVTLEYVTGVFMAPKMMMIMEAMQTSRQELRLMNMEAHMVNKKHKKGAAGGVDAHVHLFQHDPAVCGHVGRRAAAA